MNLALLLTSWRYYRHHGLQTLLLIFGIALGVALMVSVDLANHSAKRAFALAAESLTGKANYQIVGSDGRVPESLYRDLRVQHGLQNLAPVLEGSLRLPELGQARWKLIGVDPFAEAPFRDFFSSETTSLSLQTLMPLLTQPQSVMLSSSAARRWQLQPQQQLALPAGPPLQIVGFFEPQQALNQTALEQVLVADLATAQEVLGQTGYLSHIDVLLPEDDAEALAQLRSMIPPAYALERPSARTQTLLQMSRAFELNLSALSLLALLVGVFLIYNTVSFSVVQRRQDFAILRSLGASPRQIWGQVLAEVALLGLFGALLGLGLGVVLGQQVLKLVTQVINDMYYLVEVQRLAISLPLLGKGLLAGVAAACLAAWLPAREAARTPPVQVLQRSSLEDRVRSLLPRLSLAALALLALGAAALAWPTQALAPAFAGLAGVVLGSALLVPLAMLGLLRLIALCPLILWRLAARNLQRALSRSALAATALMLAVSVIIGVSVMVGSFRNTVTGWLETILAADIYLSAPQGLSLELQAELSQVPGVARIANSRLQSLELKPLGRIHLMALSHDTAGAFRQYAWLEGAPDKVWPALQAGEILISEPLAHRLSFVRQPGQVLSLPTPAGPQDFRVRGIYYDYASELGTVLLARSVYQQHWHDSGITGLAFFQTPGVSTPQLKTQLEQALAQTQLHDYDLRSNREVRDGALQIFDRTFAVTDALRLLTLVVAFLGVLATILALHLERQRETALLRTLGLSPAQLARLILYEATCLGGIAGLLALPVGLLMALVLIGVINLRSFGWSLQLSLNPEIFAQAWGLALASALLAGLWPAAQAWRQHSQHLAAGMRQE